MGQIATPATAILLPGAFANPSALVGTVAIPGVSTKAMRADAAPAINQAIQPTWTQRHIFASNPLISNVTPGLFIEETDQAIDEKKWASPVVSGKIYTLRSYDDAEVASRAFLRVTRGVGIAIADVQFGNATDNPTFSFQGTGNVSLPNNNQELRLGSTAQFREFFDGTNAVVRADSGDFRVLIGGVERMRLPSSANTISCAVGTASGSRFNSDAANLFNSEFVLQQGAIDRWNLRKSGGSETGANAGSDFVIVARDDAGAALGNAIFITRATGSMTIGFNATAGRTTLVGRLGLQSFTVATLPAGAQGDECYVTDATAPAYNTALVGGGAVRVKAFFNGAAWVAG